MVVGACSSVIPATPTELVAQPTTKPPHAAFVVVPADLGDDAAVARIRHRVHVRWMMRASTVHGDAMEPIIKHELKVEQEDRVLPVIGESSTEIRVVIENDQARVALWIDRGAAWPTTLVPIQLADRDGRVPKQAGAFLETGAPIDVAFGRDRIRHVTLRDNDVAVDGWVPSDLLGAVYLVAPDDKSETQMKTNYAESYRPPDDKRPKTKFVPHAAMRAAPDANAPVVAIVLGDVIGYVDAPGPWTIVELLRDHARIRGYVPAKDLLPTHDDVTISGVGSGSGWGISDTARIHVPKGTCLFDRANGQVAGVQLEDDERYVDIDEDGWRRVYVDSPWAVLGFFVHDMGSDPKQPKLESCAKPRR